MEALSLCSTTTFVPPACASSCNLPSRKIAFDGTRKRCAIRVSAMQRDRVNDWGRNGKLVDENMIVLRMRIQEMKMLESPCDDRVPDHWTEWEKRYFGSYESDVYEGVAILQTVLMNTRPGLALGMLALIALSVPTSVVLLVNCLVS